MHIRVGYELVFECLQPVPMILTLNIHYSRASDLLEPDVLRLSPSIPITSYRDLYGNWCSRIVAPPGRLVLTCNALVRDSGTVDACPPQGHSLPVQSLPAEALVFLLGSRYCETDLLSELAWQRFGTLPRGLPQVQAICDFVHNHIAFGYQHADSTKGAKRVLDERVGVCRDFAHLAIALCRCINIPARYCTGYLGDINVPPDPAPMDFSAWFEAYLDNAWFTFDARHNQPRAGRILIARGRDAADVAISTGFGAHTLTNFRVWTYEETA